MIDDLGNVGEDRKVVSVHNDPDLRRAIRSTCKLGRELAGARGSRRDGVLDVVVATADGRIHAFDGASPRSFPAGR